MTITVFVPDWDATPELTDLAEKRKRRESYVSSLHGYDLTFDTTEGCDVIQLSNRIETMPEPLRKIPMQSICVIKHNSPGVSTMDGAYVDGDFTGRVDTYIRDGQTLQNIRARGTNGTTIEEVNQWFDELITGNKANKNTSPTPILLNHTKPAASVTLRASGGSGPSFRKIELVLDGSNSELVARLTEVISAHFGQLTGS